MCFQGYLFKPSTRSKVQLKRSIMKTKVLLVHLFFFGLIFNSFSAETPPYINSKKIDINALEYIDGLYYYQNQLYTGMIYNDFSSKGPNQKSNGGLCCLPHMIFFVALSLNSLTVYSCIMSGSTLLMFCRSARNMIHT